MSRYNLGFAMTLLLLWTAKMQADEQKSDLKRPAAMPQSSLDWEEANAKRMFILVNHGDAISAIAVDTTHIEDLQAALKLQELVFRIGGARLPIVDKQFVTVPWGKIHIAWDHFPATPPRRPFEISMQESDDTDLNPQKQIIISGGSLDCRGGIDRAISAFTEATLGVPLEALQDKSYKWERKKVVAIPEKLKTIYGSSKAPASDAVNTSLLVQRRTNTCTGAAGPGRCLMEDR